MPSLAQVLLRLRNPSRQSRPVSLLVAAAHLSFGDLTADIVLRSIGVQRNLGPIENHQQFALVGAEPSEQPVEDDEPGLAREDAVEACPQGSPALSARILLVGFEIAIERPDQSTNPGLGLALIIGEGVELMNEPLGMNPAQAMLADVELTGVVADDHGVGQEAMRLDTAP